MARIDQYNDDILFRQIEEFKSIRYIVQLQN